jgi:hypothetical protein
MNTRKELVTRLTEAVLYLSRFNSLEFSDETEGPICTQLASALTLVQGATETIVTKAFGQPTPPPAE